MWVHLMKRAVGYGARSPFYRNHYVCALGSDSYPFWLDMVEAGLAKEERRDSEAGVTFSVTQAGIELLQRLKPSDYRQEGWQPGDVIPGPDDIHPGCRVVWLHRPSNGYGYAIRVPGTVVRVDGERVTCKFLKANAHEFEKTVPRYEIVLTSG